MNKYINIIIISFFSVLTYYLKIGFVFFIPIVCFFAFHNPKNILLIIPSSLLGLLWFNREGLLYLAVLLLAILIFMLITQNRNYYINLLFIFIISLVSAVFPQPNFELIYIIFFALVSTVIYAYFCYNIQGPLTKQNRTRNFAYNETIMAISAVLGATAIPGLMNIPLFVAMYFAMYLSQNRYYIHSVFFSLMTMLFLRFVFDIEESILIPFVSAFYIFPSIYAPLSLISFCLLGWFSNTPYFNPLTLQITIGLAIVFEIIKFMIINIHEGKDLAAGIYQRSLENINNEVIAFASFLDLFSRSFATPKEYNQKLSEGINNLTHFYCESCYVRNECYSKNKGKLYTFFKNLILYAKRSNYEFSDSEESVFLKSCPYIVEMRKSSILINEKLNLSATSTKSNALIAQINGVSNILRQYSVDNSLKNELDIEIFEKIYQGLCDYGFNVCYFQPQKMLINDFLIETGIKGETFNNIKIIIELICNNHIEQNVSCLFKSVSRGKTYVNIVPKINYDVEYGYGSIAQEGNSVCGDNYLIKHLTNTKLIAAISDGMGKGFMANQESATTLKLVDEITNTEITAETALQILNTFFFIQDYLEKYSTLDFLQLDRAQGYLLFYKMGAASSYIFHKDGSFERIINEGLPFGIEEIIEARKMIIKNEDIIIMASDGVFGNIVDDNDFETFVNGIKHLSPQKITYEILNYARKRKSKSKDDMSVIVLKIIVA
ncbi:MAG: SpoIIE family protein phosphatase [Bacilli bacterium]|nr:SpoIIE family protein phosphatase [Bacilli bacterium]